MRHLSKIPMILAVSTAGALSASLIWGCTASHDDGSETSPSNLDTSPDLVISQVYGGGGNSQAPYKNDYIELFNRGAQPVSLGGKAVQYASAADNFAAAEDVLPLPNVMLGPGKYFLIQLGGGTNGVDLPTADLTSAEATAIKLNKDKAKVAIVPAAAPLDGCGAAGTPCAPAAYIDLVGYGAASQAEGTAVGVLSNTTAALRKGGGCSDTGNNSADFEVAAPSPRNGQSPEVACDQDAGPAPDAAADGGADAAPGSDASPDAAPDATPVEAGPPASLVLLNEVKINPPGGTDSPWEYVEVLCTPGASLAGYYFAALEGDGDSSSGSPGVADIVVDLSSANCGANGLVMIKAANGGHAAGSPQTTVVTTAALETGTSPFENATTSFVLIKSPSAAITQGADYDQGDDGTLELPAGASVIDGVSTFDQADGAVDHTYAPRLQQPSGTADAASRIVGNKTPMSMNAWYFGDLTGSNPDGLAYDAAKAGPGLPAGAALTPGAANFAGPAGPNEPGPGNGTPGDDTPPGSDEGDQSEPDPSGSGSNKGGSGRRAEPQTPSSNTSNASCSATPASGAGGAGFAAMLGAALALVGLGRRRRAQ